MRVLHVIPAIAARYGGPSAATLGLCRALRSKGASTLIATTDADGAGRLAVPLGEETIFEGQPAIFFRRRLSEAFKWSADLGSWLSGNVAAFDVVHVHAVFSHSSIAAARACAAAQVPYVVRPLGTLDPWSVTRKAMRKRVLFQFGVDKMLRRAAAIHYTTEEERRLAETVVPDLPRGVIVPIGIDDELFIDAPAPDRSQPYILALSRLDTKKRFELLIRSFHSAAEQTSAAGWRLVIAGDGAPDYVAELTRLAAVGAAADRIEFRGWVSGTEKTTLVQQASLFALVSHQENFGIALAEGMASGVPALVTPGVNLSAEIRRERAGWVVDDTVHDVSRGLAEAMGDTAELETRGRHARTLANQFRWPHVADQLIALYESASRNSSSARTPSERRLA